MRRQIIIFLLLLSGIVMASKRHELIPYLADSATNTGTAVIVCPGGSYSWLCMKEEGKQVAQWLNQEGINAFILPYRVATLPAYIFGFRVLGLGHKYPDMLIDAEKALQWLYTHADSLHIDTTKIGVMGFSAGGHLAMMSYLYNPTPYKPSFICSLYPVVTMSGTQTHKRSRRGALGVWRQWNKIMQDSLSLEKHVTGDCPPVFLSNCKDDPIVQYQNSELLDSALTAEGVRHRYIQYQTGGHGFGASLKKGTPEAREWKTEFIHWLNEDVY
ncbi:MAG: alpha/beta hydrolase [Paludibacteraceae bacterium]|nr:alpha/beta hydrolase [Paludibacteraceae bacterium]